MDAEPVADAAEMEMLGGSTSSAVTAGAQVFFDGDDGVSTMSVSGFVTSVVLVTTVVAVVFVVPVVSVESPRLGRGAAGIETDDTELSMTGAFFLSLSFFFFFFFFSPAKIGRPLMEVAGWTEDGRCLDLRVREDGRRSRAPHWASVGGARPTEGSWRDAPIEAG
jgi:hypothetical protein